MKTKLNQSAKISFKIKLFLAASAFGFFAVVGGLVFLYLTLGNAKEAKAATVNISGVINSYARVTDIDFGSNEITIDRISGSHSDFGVGSKVLIIQMKGATINATNNASYGNINSYNSAGNYEFATVVNKTGSGPSYIIEVSAIFQSYDPDESVQLVSVPQYDNAVVTGEIIAAPWHSINARGGIIAFEVQHNLTLSAGINANGAGLQGGKVNKINSNPLDPADNATIKTNDTTYAQKGEGIAYYQSFGRELGKGKWANGGGGGNVNNAGGGGGGNFTAGGLGGGSFAGASGSGGNGIGGSQLTYTPSSKIFMGGGGGGGQQDSGTGTPGGNGGGIIIIRAGTITSTCGGSYSISANGANAANTSGAGNDGAGGGGAGGTILIEALDYNLSCNILVTTNGGNGGSVASATSHGGGGGGGTGANLFSAAPEAQVQVSSIPGSGGANCSGCGTANPGASCASPTCSQIGWEVPGDQLLLPVHLLSFTGKLDENNIRLDWTTIQEENNDYFTIERSDDGKAFESLETVGGKGTTTEKNAYHYIDKMPLPNINYYRLKQTDFNGQSHYSNTISVNNNLSENMQDITVNPNPFDDAFKVKFNLKSTVAVKLQLRKTNGNLVIERSMTGKIGKNEFVFKDDQGLSQGSYLLAIIPKDEKLHVIKIIKK